MKYSRRDLGALLPFLLAATQAEAQDKNLPGTGYEYKDLPVKKSGSNESRNVFNGANHSGFHVDLHITKLGPGAEPHPPHHHVHEEVVIIKTGSLAVTMSGKTVIYGPGSVVYAASGEEHGWKNPGTEPTEYFVMALGRES